MEGAFREAGLPKLRAKQVFRWIYRKGVTDFELMSDLPLELRAQLAQQFVISTPQLVHEARSTDGTRKFLFQLADGKRIESVFIPDTPKQTFCISSQVGCAMDCDFCLTGKMGFVRNLTTAEITGQVRALAEATGLRDKPFNVVMMGMGEPLHNYDAVMSSLRVMADGQGLAVPPRRVTLSTVGVVPAMERLAKEPVMPNLAVSLHATTNATRDTHRPHQSQVHTRTAARHVPAVPAESPKTNHVRVRAARRRERHPGRRATPRQPAWRHQGKGQPASAQRRAGHPVRAPLRRARQRLREDPC